MSSILLHGATWVDNFGDTLFFEVFGSELLKNGHKPFLYNANEKIVKNLTFEISNERNVFKAIKKANYIVYVGGGYLGEPSDITTKKRLHWSFRNLVKCYSIAILGAIYNKKILICGAGAGPITNSILRKIVKFIGNKSEQVVVRDIQSYEFLKEIGVKESQVKMTADTLIAVDRIYPEFQSQAKNKKVLIHLSVSPEKNEKSKKIWTQVLKFVDENPDFEIYGINDHCNSAQREFLSFVTRKLGEDRVINYTTPIELVRVLSLASIVITEKLHVGIIASSFGGSVYSLPQHSKTVRYYSQIGYLDRHITNEDLDSGGLYEKMMDSKNDAVVVPQEVKDKAYSNFKIMNEFTIPS